MSTDIVVGVDGSANSEAALRWAVDEAGVRGVRVRAVLTWSFLGQDDGGLGMGTTHDQAQAAVEEFVARVVGDDPAAAGRVDAVAVNDLAVPGLLDQARDAALLVVGSRGRSTVRGLLLGSTSRSVVEQAPCPVVIIPHEVRA